MGSDISHKKLSEKVCIIKEFIFKTVPICVAENVFALDFSLFFDIFKQFKYFEKSIEPFFKIIKIHSYFYKKYVFI